MLSHAMQNHSEAFLCGKREARNAFAKSNERFSCRAGFSMIALVFEKPMRALCCQLLGYINRSGKLQAF